MSSKKHRTSSLNGASKFRVGQEFTTSAIKAFLESLDCPRALTVWLLYESGEHEQLAKLEFNPSLYHKTVELAAAYAATKFLSKFKKLNLSYDKAKVALDKFEKFELLCKQTNNRLRFLSADPLFNGPAVWLHNAVVRKIEWILGVCDLDEFFDLPDWGPGASTLIKRRDASSPTKFQCETGITRELISLIPLDLIREKYPLWGQHLESVGFPHIEKGNRIITVAKDATTDRVIAIEPGINLWFQLSLGKMIRRRLLRVGIDLRDQTRNQTLAKLGSIDASLATVDLSSASDSISRNVVEELLPPRWYALMDACRSHYGTLGSQELKWEKFSSMGNGFTFDLESLIFYAIAACCTEYMHADLDKVGVYGDDVIIPTSAFKLFSTMLEFYGFQINGKKSHVTSSFRESCGAHYNGGVDVKPIYLKDRLSTLPTIFSFANAVRLLAHRRGSCISCDVSFKQLHSRLVQKVPVDLRRFVPMQVGDAGFISNFDEARPAKAKNGIEGYRVFGFVNVRKGVQYDKPGLLFARLWDLEGINPPKSGIVLAEDYLSVRGVPSTLETIDETQDKREPFGEKNTIPLGDLRLRLVKSVVRWWPDLGPWL